MLILSIIFDNIFQINKGTTIKHVMPLNYLSLKSNYQFDFNNCPYAQKALSHFEDDLIRTQVIHLLIIIFVIPFSDQKTKHK